jgi:hypothetical protein
LYQPVNTRLQTDALGALLSAQGFRRAVDSQRIDDRVAHAHASTDNLGESGRVDSKHEFDPTSASESCELVKDIVAMANWGGGTIVIGLESDGSRTASRPLTALDQAMVVDRGGLPHTPSPGVAWAPGSRLLAGGNAPAGSFSKTADVLVTSRSVRSAQLADSARGGERGHTIVRASGD